MVTLLKSYVALSSRLKMQKENRSLHFLRAYHKLHRNQISVQKTMHKTRIATTQLSLYSFPTHITIQLNTQQFMQYSRADEALLRPVTKIYNFAYSHGLVRFSFSVCMCVYVCVCVLVCYNRSYRSYLSENEKCKKLHLQIFDIYRLTFTMRMVRCENCTA